MKNQYSKDNVFDENFNRQKLTHITIKGVISYYSALVREVKTPNYLHGKMFIFIPLSYSKTF